MYIYAISDTSDVIFVVQTAIILQQDLKKKINTVRRKRRQSGHFKLGRLNTRFYYELAEIPGVARDWR
jgi:hypothetical protein